MFRNVLAGVFPGAVRPKTGVRSQPRRAQLSRARRSAAVAAAAKASCEVAATPVGRSLQGEALHGMQLGEEAEGQEGLLNEEEAVEAEGGQPERGGSADSMFEEDPEFKKMFQDDEEEEVKWKKYAKEQILNADSFVDMFDVACEWIEEDWLGGIDELPGNIYRIAALGTLTEKLFQGKKPETPIPDDDVVEGEDDESASETLQLTARFFGCLSIVVIQVIGPPAIFASAFFGWGSRAGNLIHWDEWELSTSDWAHIKVTKILASVFLFAFSLNGLYVIIQEKKGWTKIYKTLRFLQHNTPAMDVTGEKFLFAGALINMWVVLWCCLDSFVVLGASFCPRGVLFDALGLLFLYNLDDIDGDLGFVSSDDWDGVRLGWIYEEIVKKNYCVEADKDKFNPHELPRKAKIIRKLYDITTSLLAISAVVLPVMAAITPFLAITPEDFE